jgi:hypothetical protein
MKRCGNGRFASRRAGGWRRAFGVTRHTCRQTRTPGRALAPVPGVDIRCDLVRAPDIHSDLHEDSNLHTWKISVARRLKTAPKTRCFSRFARSGCDRGGDCGRESPRAAPSGTSIRDLRTGVPSPGRKSRQKQAFGHPRAPSGAQLQLQAHLSHPNASQFTNTKGVTLNSFIPGRERCIVTRCIHDWDACGSYGSK